MKALTFDPETEAFALADLAEPQPGAGDVLVQVEACGLNPVDAKIRQWKRAVPEMTRSWVPGLDVSGRIVEVGAGVSDWKVGDRILCHGNMFRPHGGFAELTVQEAACLIPHPELAASVAAATPCAGWTAWRALQDKLRAGERRSIFIAGGSGGVGGFATQIAAHFGLNPIIATCSPRNHDYVRELGATHVIDYRSEDVVARVLEITGGEGVSIGLDTVGPDNDVWVADALAFEGEMVELVDTVRPERYREAFMRGLGFHQLSLGAGHRHGATSKAALVAAGRSFSVLVEQGAVRVPMLQTLDLDQTADALNGMLKQRTVGKIVMTMEG